MTKFDGVSGHFTANAAVDKEELKELLTKAITMLDFHEEVEGRTETAKGFISWRFYRHAEETE